LCFGRAARLEVPPLHPTIDALNGKDGMAGSAGGAPLRSYAAASYSGGATNGTFPATCAFVDPSSVDDGQIFAIRRDASRAAGVGSFGGTASWAIVVTRTRTHAALNVFASREACSHTHESACQETSPGADGRQTCCGNGFNLNIRPARQGDG